MKDCKVLALLAIEYWKLLRAFERAITRLPQEHVAKSAAQLRFSANRLDALLQEGGLNLVTFDGQAYEPNMAATALNADDFSGEERLVVDSTVEPALIEDMTVIVFGKVLLKKVADGG